MTEAEWAAADDPEKMLEFLGCRRVRRKMTGRKFRLFSCACCRRVWDLIPSVDGRRAVEVAEEYAGGRATEEARSAAEAAVYEAAKEEGVILGYKAFKSGDTAGLALSAVGDAVGGIEPARVAWSVALAIAFDASKSRSGDIACATERAVQAAVLRDLFGNPFRPPSPLPEGVIAWNDGTVRRIAEAVYENRHPPSGTLDTARLAVLADALLDAGCTDDELIRHCRSEGPHVRGCWAVDLILGKS